MNGLIILAKYPEPGRVKTRLAETIGNERAAELYRTMTEMVVAQTQPPHHEYEQICYCDPPERKHDFERWLSLTHFAPQHGATLGERMHHALTQSLQRYAKAVIIGTDCIEVDFALIQRAFATLDATDLVIGPATDGGYYLIGCTQDHPALFQNISWSTDVVFQQTMQQAEILGLTTTRLPTLSDIDSHEDAHFFLAPHLKSDTDRPRGE
jgi:uncharacterized protein